MKIKVVEDYALGDAIEAMKTTVLAGDDVYDVFFAYNAYMSSLTSDNYLYDMQDLSGFHFDKPWWDGESTESLRLGSQKRTLFAYTDASLTDFQGTLVTFFNENMVEDRGLESPYGIAENGNWTLDKMSEYMKAGADLNGADNFTFNADANTTYGLVSWDQGEIGLVIGSGRDFVTIEKNQPVITAGDEKFIEAIQKVITTLSKDGEYLCSNASGAGHYEQIFKAGRAMLAISELKATNKYRDMNDSFGILPMPKVDESQEKYSCLRNFSYLLCIPATNEDAESAAVIMDAMSYLTYKNVMEPFYEGRVSQKSLRNEDSIKMLELIRESRVTEIGRCFGWTSSYRYAINTCVTAKSTDIVSKFAELKSGTEAKITATMDVLEN